MASDLSVRQAEAEVLRLKGGGKAGSGGTRAAGKKLSADLADIQERLIEFLGTKVTLRGTTERGSIQVSYFSRDDLQRLLEALGVG